MAQFSEDDIQAAIEKLSDRQLTGKAIPMARKYDSEPKRAYAGNLTINVQQAAQ